MRLHTLSITAFGPFADTVTVDFDELSDAGLFLLTGTTGAGKSSVLDAVCFALYGQVPGDRQTARQLRCDRAPATVAPEVRLEASIRGRRFRFVRSPQWERPKRRGTGTTRVQAHVVVEEHRDGGWSVLTNRLDDAGLLVGELLGMTCAQFTQVALLPQGQFMTFLRARSVDRQQVLQRLFRTDRFERVEQWLVDRRVSLRRRHQAHNDEVAGVLNRLQEAAGATVPDDWDLADLAGVVEAADVQAWADRLRSEASERAAAAARTRVRLTEDAAALEAARDAARRQVTLRDRGAAARSRLAELERRSDDLERVRDRLHRHDRARPLRGLVEAAHEAGHEARTARSTWHEAATRAGAEVPGLGLGDALLDEAGDTAQALIEAERSITGCLARVEAFAPRLEQLHACHRRRDELEARLAEVRAGLPPRRDRLEALPTRIEELREERDRLAPLAGSVATCDEQVTTARARLRDHEELTRVTAELTEARAALEDATARTLQRREAWLDLREARLQGMAAELAGDLAAGCTCPVCGSAEHPQPAVPAPDAVTRADEDEARRLLDEAEFDKHVRDEKVRDLARQHDRLEHAVAGRSRDDLVEAVRAAEQATDEARIAEQVLPRVEAALRAAEAEHETLRQEVQRLEVEEAETASALDAVRETLAEAEDALGELLALRTGVASVPELEHRLQVELRSVRTALEAWRHHFAARQQAADTTDRLRRAAAEAGFADAGALEAAVLDDDDATRLRADLESAEESRRGAEAVLADDDVVAALAGDPPDLDELVARARDAVAARDDAVAHDAERRRCVTRLEHLGGELEAALTRWAPVRLELERTTRLAALCEGKGHENPLRIRLSAYVLGERLRQVVAAANERLHRMTSGRYLLEHSDERTAGDQRGGLGLRVVDAWSGLARDPATLSGGETFLVSLALALGLADTVTHEAGGTDIDTLFVDEGFGTLDADTLDEVMDTLDTLREGGRVVGIVSHVAELRVRIPTQLEVRAGRRGSTLRPVVAAG